MSSQKIEAVYLVKPGKIEIRESEINPPKEGEVQIQVKACGVCTGDVNVFKGIDVEWYQSTWGDLPTIAGHEGVGVVNKVGRNINDLTPGDKVTLVWGECLNGHFASHVNLSREQVAKIPEDVEDFCVWITEPQACVINALYHTQIFPGERLLVIGCGFMGLLIIQALKGASFAGEIIGVDIDNRRLKMAKEFGANVTFNNNKEDDISELTSLFSNKTDIVIETAGVQETLYLGTKLVRPGGKFTIFAWHHGNRIFNGTKWHLGGIRVLNAGPAIEPNFLRIFKGTVALMKRGIFNLSPLITHRLSYKKAQQMFEIATEPGKYKYIKGVLTF